MKPLVSAAAAAILLVGGRRGGAPNLVPPPLCPDPDEHDDDGPPSNHPSSAQFLYSRPRDDDHPDSDHDSHDPPGLTAIDYPIFDTYPDAESVADAQFRLSHDAPSPPPPASPSTEPLTSAKSTLLTVPSQSQPNNTNSAPSPTSTSTSTSSTSTSPPTFTTKTNSTTDATAKNRNPPFADWDWTDPPDDSSIWRATAAILGGTLSRSAFSSDTTSSSPASPSQDDDPAALLSAQWKDGVETLSAALRGLRVFPTSSDSDDPDSSRPFSFSPASFTGSDAAADSDADSDAGSSSSDMDSDSNDVRPLIAVTIGLTLFLLSRSPKAARRAELEAGVPPPGAAVFDEDDSDDLLLLRDGDEGAAHTPADYAVISDLRSTARHIVIITTAALPWMTGTAVNPLLRAVYLAKAGHEVSLVVPWLESPEDQRKVYPAGTLFASREEQTRVILAWARNQVPDIDIRIRFYEGVYSNEFGSILPLGDITALFADDPEHTRDVCVLEEPEHLTWYHSGRRWTRLFRFCVGVVHTNYLEYARKHGVFGPQRALFLNFLNKWVCRSYCHRVIKLSDAVQTLPHSVTCNVHGVRNRFLDIGTSRRGEPFSSGAYFLGKVLWAKGYQQLVELMEDHHVRTNERLPIDFFGAGPDLDEVKARVSSSYALSRVQIHGVVVDHASDYLQRYKVYVNPSKSDVVCTATAEALAMGKFVVCLKHPSNEFFATFDNCLIYETDQQFSAQLAYALQHEPKPLSDHDVFRLSWEAATERFYDACAVEAPVKSGRVDSALALTHKTICKTLVTPPANSAVRQRYRSDRRPLQLGPKRNGSGGGSRSDQITVS